MARSLKFLPSFEKYISMVLERKLKPWQVRQKGNTEFLRKAGESGLKAKTRFLIGQNPEPEDLKKVDQEEQEQEVAVRDASTKVKSEPE